MTNTKRLAALALLLSFAGCAVATPPKGTTPKMTLENGK